MEQRNMQGILKRFPDCFLCGLLPFFLTYKNELFVPTE